MVLHIPHSSKTIPFGGALVLLKYYQQDKWVKAIMLEVNRALYMQNYEKSENFIHLRSIIIGFLALLNESFV